jgi:hypothetical protein
LAQSSPASGTRRPWRRCRPGPAYDHSASFGTRPCAKAPEQSTACSSSTTTGCPWQVRERLVDLASRALAPVHPEPPLATTHHPTTERFKSENILIIGFVPTIRAPTSDAAHSQLSKRERKVCRRPSKQRSSSTLLDLRCPHHHPQSRHHHHPLRHFHPRRRYRRGSGASVTRSSGGSCNCCSKTSARVERASGWSHLLAGSSSCPSSLCGRSTTPCTCGWWDAGIRDKMPCCYSDVTPTLHTTHLPQHAFTLVSRYVHSTRATLTSPPLHTVSRCPAVTGTLHRRDQTHLWLSPL